MSSQVVTSNEGEKIDFNFDDWISSNGLDSVKNILKNNGAITPSTLTMSSDEIKATMQDPQLLQQMHMIPLIFQAIAKINNQRFDYPNNIFIFSPNAKLRLYIYNI